MLAIIGKLLLIIVVIFLAVLLSIFVAAGVVAIVHILGGVDIELGNLPEDNNNLNE